MSDVPHFSDLNNDRSPRFLAFVLLLRQMLGWLICRSQSSRQNFEATFVSFLKPALALSTKSVGPELTTLPVTTSPTTKNLQHPLYTKSAFVINHSLHLLNTYDTLIASQAAKAPLPISLKATHEKCAAREKRALKLLKQLKKKKVEEVEEYMQWEKRPEKVVLQDDEDEEDESEDEALKRIVQEGKARGEEGKDEGREEWGPLMRRTKRLVEMMEKLGVDA